MACRNSPDLGQGSCCIDVARSLAAATKLGPVKLDLPMGQIAIKEITMKRLNFFLAVSIALIAASAVRLHAQSGCEDSPENPTAVLALLGSLAAFGQYAYRRFLGR